MRLRNSNPCGPAWIESASNLLASPLQPTALLGYLKYMICLLLVCGILDSRKVSLPVVLTSTRTRFKILLFQHPEILNLAFVPGKRHPHMIVCCTGCGTLSLTLGALNSKTRGWDTLVTNLLVARCTHLISVFAGNGCYFEHSFTQLLCDLCSAF